VWTLGLCKKNATRQISSKLGIDMVFFIYFSGGRKKKNFSIDMECIKLVRPMNSFCPTIRVEFNFIEYFLVIRKSVISFFLNKSATSQPNHIKTIMNLFFKLTRSTKLKSVRLSIIILSKIQETPNHFRVPLHKAYKNYTFKNR
jgi:hypothetical protein